MKSTSLCSCIEHAEHKSMKVMRCNVILSINKLSLADIYLLVVHMALVESSPLTDYSLHGANTA